MPAIIGRPLIGQLVRWARFGCSVSASKRANGHTQQQDTRARVQAHKHTRRRLGSYFLGQKYARPERQSWRLDWLPFTGVLRSAWTPGHAGRFSTSRGPTRRRVGRTAASTLSPKKTYRLGSMTQPQSLTGAIYAPSRFHRFLSLMWGVFGLWMQYNPGFIFHSKGTDSMSCVFKGTITPCVVCRCLVNSRAFVVGPPAGCRGGVRGACGRPDRPVSGSEARVLLSAAQASRGLSGGAPVSHGEGGYLWIDFVALLCAPPPPPGIMCVHINTLFKRTSSCILLRYRWSKQGRQRTRVAFLFFRAFFSA